MPDIPSNPIRDANLVKRGKSRRQKVVLTIGDNKYTIDEFKELTVGKDINGIIITGKNIIMKLYNSDGCKSRVITEDRLTKFISDLVHQGFIAYPEPWCTELRSHTESLRLVMSSPVQVEVEDSSGTHIEVISARDAVYRKLLEQSMAGNVKATALLLQYSRLDESESSSDDTPDNFDIVPSWVIQEFTYGSGNVMSLRFYHLSTAPVPLVLLSPEGNVVSLS